MTAARESLDTGLKVIILDQNAISNLALNPNKDWTQILELLRRGVKAGKILCPTPIETVNETVHLPRDDRKRIETLCAELSNGFFVKFFWQLVAQEILATVRPGIDTFPLWIPEQIHESSDEENFRSREAINKEKAWIETDVNSFQLPGKSKEFTVAQAQELVVSDWLNTMRSYLNKFRNGQMIGDEQFMIQMILHTLNELKVTDREITGLLEGIQSRRWLEIPILFCWLLLGGLLMFDFAQRGRKFRINDEWDKFRAAAAFQFAHCFITDRGTTSMLKQLKFRDEKLFEVFSVAETANILVYFKSVC